MWKSISSYIFVLSTMLISVLCDKDFYDCAILEGIVEEKQALKEVTDAFELNKDFSESCLQILVNKNFYSSIEYLVNNVFNEDNDYDAVPALKRYISKVRERQDSVINLASEKRNIVTIGPAFQWAQDMNSVALLVKFAHRMDSPACIDLYDQNVTITETNITITCMCRKRDEIVRFYMNHELYMKISGNYSEFQSGGRLYLNLTKAEGNQRWRRLLFNEEQPRNMRVWYELMESIGDISENTVFETDDAFEDLVHIDKPTRKKKSKGGKKKKNKKKRKINDDL
ncbi:unnamed protein product [Moneuplotes crassus]|uniref:CS domain-containing protein n=1 Tax=Euplotes crassus TaxID=5936 RepID=A0AAD1XRJ8_EUPCR|nr:unnamed protein product [Moneuplotes crassus]